MSTYFKNIAQGIGTTLKGMQLTWRHLWQARKRRMSTDIRSGNFFDMQEGMVTIQYPQETVAIPDNGRYRLHNEIDDCIVCDKCVKVCPVDCIDIEPIRAIEEVGRASDGSPIRLYAAKFDIDMAKCCYCGLCTTVCPTECLTMTKTFDYSELDVRDMVYNYANLTADEADEKRRLLEQFQKEKEALKAAQKPVTASEVTPGTPAARPAFKPTIKPKTQETEAKEEVSAAPKPAFLPRKPTPAVSKTESEKEGQDVNPETPAPKLPFKPSMKPKAEAPADVEPPVSETTAEEAAKAKPTFRPTMKPKADVPADTEPSVSEPISEEVAKPKPAFRPTMKPKVEAPADIEPPVSETSAEEGPKPKPAFRPTMKPKVETPADKEPLISETTAEETPKAKPAFRPTMKPKVEAPVDTEPPVSEMSAEEAPKPKPAFRPTMKPKVFPSAPAEKPVTDAPNETSETNSNPVSEDSPVETPKPKPAFRPTMKPKPKQE